MPSSASPDTLASASRTRTPRSAEAARRARSAPPTLELLRILAYNVMRRRYAAELMRMEGGRRGKPPIVTFTFHLEAADLAEGRDAVKEIVRRREAR